MNRKVPYEKPQISLHVIDLECGIATGSAQVLADDSQMDMYEEWNQDDDQRKIIDWM